MTVAPPTLNANPLALVRSLPISLIPIDQIKAPEELATDEVFVSKYSTFLRGHAPIHETRVSLARIRRGLWKRTVSGWELLESPAHAADVAYAIDMLRLGNRPVLHLYENPNPSDDKRFVCTDDTIMHAAYEESGISNVPVALMARPRGLEESCLSVRCFPRKGKEYITLLGGVVPVTHDSVPSILGATKPPVEQSLVCLLRALQEVKNKLKRFHQPGAVTLHYHHTLYSVLLRAEECVDSIHLLIASKKPLIAAGLLRSLYELALIFYVDWLAPNLTYRYLQFASTTSEKAWEALCEEWQKADLAAGVSLINAKNIKDAHMRGFRLCSVVGERARVFPLGENFQRDIYSFLSDVVHHDFSMTARYTHTLDHGDEAVYYEDVMKTLVHIADILVASIVSRVRSDIGNVSEKLPSDC